MHFTITIFCFPNLPWFVTCFNPFHVHVTKRIKEFLINKGKCSHGGILDSSRHHGAEGGINKDSTSPVFSPHHYLHKEAAHLAATATLRVLQDLRDEVGPKSFLRSEVNSCSLYSNSLQQCEKKEFERKEKWVRGTWINVFSFFLKTFMYSFVLKKPISFSLTLKPCKAITTAMDQVCYTACHDRSTD